jgi:hypothetical protein
MGIRHAFLVLVVLGAAATIASAGSVLDDDFDDNVLDGWSNDQLASNWKDSLGRGDDGLMPVVSGGVVMGTEYGYHHGRWMNREITGNAAEWEIAFGARAGVGAIGQTSVILADTTWGGDGTRLVGYEINVYGESAQQLWITRYDGDNPSTRVLTAHLGSSAFLMNDYVVSRDSLGNWQVLQDGTLLTPISATADLTYTDFDYVAVNVGTPDDQLDYLSVSVVPLPAAAWAGLALLGGLGAVRTAARRRRKTRI